MNSNLSTEIPLVFVRSTPFKLTHGSNMKPKIDSYAHEAPPYCFLPFDMPIPIFVFDENAEKT
jgi:hypothetical protein